ncbi:MAG: hypothetical protein KAY37_12010 [Phycisphaerae bacterium]|nr:hypothetical protein [Phycisphaerae bacterium]
MRSRKTPGLPGRLVETRRRFEGYLDPAYVPRSTAERVADFHTPQALREMLDHDFEGELAFVEAHGRH